MAKVKVTRNYQITIPREIRRKMGIEEGSYVSIEAVNETTTVLKRVLP
ncbi:MAG: AbrB/MazE/SpoVT family DNA-binding domain-containing protein [Candidatus Bathyarchaeia archaeon]|nr:AbrB/MazE/SpoVT family DNA-binding domain-containing protein [Candidatus Bathyarchaeota archaeon]